VPNVEDHDLAGLEEERTRLHEELVGVGDFRQGSVYSVHRPCGKPHCACAEPRHPGHGPLHLLSSLQSRWMRSLSTQSQNSAIRSPAF